LRQLRFGNPIGIEVAHVNARRTVAGANSLLMGLDGAHVIVDEVLEPRDIGIDRTHVVTRTNENIAVTLAAADRDHRALTRGSICRNRRLPWSRLGDLRQAGEIGGKIGQFLIAHLLVEESRHDAPRLTHSAAHLRIVQTATREIGAEGAFGYAAMAVLA